MEHAQEKLIIITSHAKHEGLLRLLVMKICPICRGNEMAAVSLSGFAINYRGGY